MTKYRALVILAIALSLPLLLAACFGADSERSESTDHEEYVSFANETPLGRLFSKAGGESAASSLWEFNVEATVVDCMKLQGFDYTPQGTNDLAMQSDRGHLSREDWTAEYGYGLSTSFEALLSEVVTDPNEIGLASMTLAEADAYEAALSGQGPTANLVDQGCRGEALLANGGLEIVEAFAKLADAHAEDIGQIMLEPKVQEATLRWSECMKQEGWNVATRSDATSLIVAQMSDLPELLDLDFGLLEPQDLAAAMSEPDSNIPSLQNLRHIQRQEIAIATSDLRCYRKHVEATYAPLKHDSEERLIDQFANELEVISEVIG